MPVNNSVKPIVIFVASSTPEKARDLQIVAEYKHLPIIFEDINKLLGAFHHADEINGTYVGNTKGKLDSVIHHISAFRAGNKTAKGQDYKERVENYLKERGLPAGTQMYIAAEDGGFALPQKVWNNIQVDGKIDGVPGDVLKKITPDSKYPEFTGPGSETAPVMSGMLGEYNLMKRVRDAVLSLGSDTGKIPMLQNCAFNMMKINEGAKDDIISVEAHTKNILHFPTDNSLDKLFKDNGGRIGNFLYAKPEKYLDKADEGKTIAEMGKEGIAKYSVRARIVDEIYNKMFSEEIKAGYKPDYQHPHKDKVSGQLFRVGAFGAHDNEALFDKIKALKLGKNFITPKVGGNFSAESSYDILRHIEHDYGK